MIVLKSFLKKKNSMKYLLLFLSLVFFSGCQDTAKSNVKSSSCPQTASLKYPLKTGQTGIFVYEDIGTNPSSYYYDDGYDKKGYTREFNNLGDGTVYNANYDLYWQDNNATLDYNSTSAAKYCSDLNLSGRTDWRLPNVYELMTLLDLNSRTNMRESSFDNMPIGAYFSNREVFGTPKVIVVNFGEHDFNATKIFKVYNIDSNDSIYGTQIGATTLPKYSSKGVLVTIKETILYYNSIKNLETTVGTITAFDENGTITSVSNIFLQEIPLHPPVVDEVAKSYVKCVSGTEVQGFDFVRDDRKEIVFDSATNLAWQDNEDVVNKNQTWGTATKYCKKLDLGGFKDWRLPTISELITLNDFADSGTYSVSNVFKFRSANKFHSSSDSCFFKEEDPTCYQKNYQLNTCGYLDDKITQNLEVDINPYYDNGEPLFKTRCVRCGSYN